WSLLSMTRTCKSFSPLIRSISSNPAGPAHGLWSRRLSDAATWLLLFWLIPAAFAQVSATVSGRVSDPTNNGASGAKVTLASTETGAVRTTTTGESGDYRFTSLPLGPQELRAEKQGFKVAVRTGIKLDVGEEAVVDLHLEVGELSQSVTVSAEAPVVNTTTSSVSGVVDERDVKDLPLNGRSFDNLIALNPGAINYALKSANTSTSNGNTFSVSGRRPGDNLSVPVELVEICLNSSQLAINRAFNNL